MKSMIIIMHEVIEREYYLTAFNRWFGQYFELCVDASSDEVGKIDSRDTHVKWEVVKETNEFARELKKDELIHIDNENYKIAKVSHEPNGSIIYYLNKKQIIDNEESKKKAESDLQKRTKILLNRLKKEKEEKIEEKLIFSEEKCNRKKKKWYQIFE